MSSVTGAELVECEEWEKPLGNAATRADERLQPGKAWKKLETGMPKSTIAKAMVKLHGEPKFE